MTTHRMSIQVSAWRVAEDGSLPEEAREAIVAFDPDLISPEEAWVWYMQTDRDSAEPVPGDWVVIVGDQIAILSDEQFRECCVEVCDDA